MENERWKIRDNKWDTEKDTEKLRNDKPDKETEEWRNNEEKEAQVIRGYWDKHLIKKLKIEKMKKEWNNEEKIKKLKKSGTMRDWNKIN